MRPRNIGLIAAAVLGVHLLVLWGPGDAWTQAPRVRSFVSSTEDTNDRGDWRQGRR